MKILHRYILREFLESFFFGLVVFSIILLLDQIFQLINLFLGKGIALATVLQLFLLILPNILSLTIPMAVIFGILLSYGRLSEDNEITSMRSAGLAYKTFTLPVILLVAFLSVFLVYFNQSLSPITHRQFRAVYKEIIARNPLIKFEEKVVTSLGDYRIYADKVEETSLRGVNIYKFSPQDQGAPWRISASSAVVSVNPEGVNFSLYDGYWQQPNPANPAKIMHVRFMNYRFLVQLTSPIVPFSQSLREMTGPELIKEIAAYREKHMPTTFLETEYWLRYALSLAPLVFAVIGIPLGIVLERGGKSIGFGISLVILFGYYLLLVTGLNIGEKGLIRPGIILFLPNVIMLGIGVYLWKKMVRK